MNTRPRARKITPERYKDLIYKQNLPLKEAARILGVSVSGLISFRVRHNLPTRGWANGIHPMTGTKMPDALKQKLRSINTGRASWNKQKRITVHCNYCSRKFPTRPYLVNIGKGQFCSKKCFDLYRVGRHTVKDFFKKGEEHPFYVKNKITRNSSNVWSHAEKRKIAANANWRCQQCCIEIVKKPIYKLRKSCFFDHITAIALGGTHEIRNGQLLCPECNLMKTRDDLRKAHKQHNFIGNLKL